MSDKKSTSFSRLLSRYFDAAARGLFTTLPGKVVKFYDNQTVDVQIMVKFPVPGTLVDPEATEAELLEEYPILLGVPFQFLRSGNFRITHPVKGGDFVTLFFSHTSIENFITGSGDAPADPQDVRHHNLSDAVAYPGMFPLGTSFTDISLDEVQIIYEPSETVRTEFRLLPDGNVILVPGGTGKVKVGSETAVEPMVLGTTLNSSLQALMSAMQAAAPTFVTAPPSGGPSPLNPAVVTALTNFLSSLSAHLSQKGVLV